MSSAYVTPYAPRDHYRPSNLRDITELILRGGEIQADREMAGALPRAALFHGLGNLASAGVEAYAKGQEQKRQQEGVSKRTQAWFGAMQSGALDDPKQAQTIALSIFGPDDYLTHLRAYYDGKKLLQSEEQDPNNLIKEAASVAASLQKFTPAERAQAWPTLVAPLAKKLGDTSDEYNPEVHDDWINRLASLLPKEKPIVVGRDSTALDPETYEPVYTAPEKPAKVGKQWVTRPGVGAVEIDEGASQPGDVPYRAPERTGGSATLTPTAEANLIQKLSNDWGKAVKPAAELSRQAKLMDAGMAAAERGDLAAGSQAVLVTFQKILDPMSVVRESEYARSAAGQALLARIRGAAEKLAKGGAGVPLSELKKYQALAHEMVRAQSGDYLQAQKKRIGSVADRYNIPRELIFEDFDFGAAPQQSDPLGLR